MSVIVALSKREKMIAIGVGAALALYGLDQTVLSPYLARLKDIEDNRSRAVEKKAERTALFAREVDLRKVWNDLTRGGLSTDPSAAESQALRAVLAWASDAGVNVTALKPDRSSDESVFQVISFHVTGTGNTPAVAKLLWDIETATIPVRLTDVQVAPRKEGTDDLTVQFGVCTLCQPPRPADAKPGALTAAGYYGRDRS